MKNITLLYAFPQFSLAKLFLSMAFSLRSPQKQAVFGRFSTRAPHPAMESALRAGWGRFG
jgi:hypothetical protein